MSRSHHASDCRSGTIGATVSYTGSVFCSVSMSTNRRVHTPLHLICIQCRTNSLFCISERPLGRGDTSIFSLTRCISTGILSYTASLYNTSTPHRNLYVGITESISYTAITSRHLLFFVLYCLYAAAKLAVDSISFLLHIQYAEKFRNGMQKNIFYIFFADFFSSRFALAANFELLFFAHI